jgi:autotransporter-associated beta strand protein
MKSTFAYLNKCNVISTVHQCRVRAWFLGGLVTMSLCVFAGVSHASTVTYTLQDSTFPTQFNNGGDFYSNGTTELGMWANNGSKQTVAWRNFETDGNNTGSNRSLQVGDVFTITVAATRAFGQIGFSLNAGGTQGSSYANNISGSRLYFNTDNYGAWYGNSSAGGATLGAGYFPIQSTYKDYKFTVRITSETTADAFLTVDGVDYRSFNLTMNGAAGTNINAFSVYGSDMWDGDSNDDAYWKQTTSVQNTSTVQLGYFLASGTFNPGVVKNGLAADSTSTVSANDVFVGGDSGSVVLLDDNNTYTGATTINAAATARASNNNAFGTTAGSTTVTSGGRIQPNNNVTISEAVTLNGTGIASSGALQNVSGTNIWSGQVTLGSATRINSDAGSLTLSSGTAVTGSGMALTVGGNGNTTISGVIATGSGTLTKDGSGTLTASAINTYTGATSVNAGTLKVSAGGSIASSSLTTVNSGGTIAGSGTVGALSLSSGGTVAPGDSGIGTLNGSSATWNGGGAFKFDLSNSGSTSDKLSLSGALTKGSAGTFQFDFQNSGLGVTGSPVTYTLASFASTTFSAGDFSYVNLGSLGGQTGTFAIVSGGTQLQLTVVPEPGTFAMLLGGVGMLAMLRRRV